MSNYVKATGGLINKSLDDINNRIVAGYYTGDNVDMYGHMIHPEGMIAAINDYKQWGTIREMHEAPVGVAESIGIPMWNYIRARVSNTTRGNEVLQLVSDGVYSAFSVGIIVTKAEFVKASTVAIDKFQHLPQNIIDLILEMGDVFVIREMSLIEVSIVDRPANPAARVAQFSKNLAGGSCNILPAIYALNKEAVNGDILAGNSTMIIVDEVVKQALNEKVKSFEEAELENTEMVAEVEGGLTETETTVAEVTEAKNVEQETESSDVAEVVDSVDSQDVVSDNAQHKDVVTLEKQVLDLMEKTIALVDNVAQRITNVESLIEKMIAANDNATSDQEKDVTEGNEGNDPEYIQKIVDGVVSKLYDMGAADRLGRKGAVNNGEQAPVLNTKSMSTDELSRFIALRISGRA